MIQARLGAINTGHSDGPGTPGGSTPTSGGGTTYHSPYTNTYRPPSTATGGGYQPPPGPYTPPPPYQGPTVYPPPGGMPPPLPQPPLPPPTPESTYPQNDTGAMNAGTNVLVTTPGGGGYAIAGRTIPIWALALGAGIIGIIIAIVVTRK